jgi:hypothetical protein
MNKLMLLMCMVLITFQSHSAGMYENAKEVGINGRCLSDLKFLTDYLKPDGAVLNFVNPSNPNEYSSYHIGLKNNIDGSTAYIVSLSPKNNNCSYSYSRVNSYDKDSCTVVRKKLESLDGNLKIILDQQGYTALKNLDNNTLIVMTERNPTACTVIETQSVFPNN